MINDSMKQTILGLMRKFPCTDSAILPSLCFIQKEKGHISEEDMKELSGILQFSEARIYSVASFYSMLRLKARARYHIQVCSNVSCSLLETKSLLDYISGKLGIGEGETTADGLFSLESVECLGSCGYAPAMMINTEHYENMSFEKADEIIRAIYEQNLTEK